MQPAAPESAAPAAFSYTAFALSLIAGLALGIALGRLLGPLPGGEAEPWQLRAEDRNHYMLAIALEYHESGDAARALDKLIALKPAGDPLVALAEGACALGSGGYLADASGIAALRSAVQLYQDFGREGCAERLLPEAAPAALPAEPPPPAADARAQPTPLPSKTPPPASAQTAQTARLAPTPLPRRFREHSLRSFCDIARPAIIEVRTVDYLGRGVPGQRIRVRWGESEDIFLTGIKREYGDNYGDFQMEEGVEYAVDMPGAAEPLATALSTGSCYSDNRRGLKSWRVSFVEV